LKVEVEASIIVENEVELVFREGEANGGEEGKGKTKPVDISKNLLNDP